MSDERGDRGSPDIDDRKPANGSRKLWVAPKVIASELSLTATAVRAPKEPVSPSPRNTVPVS